MSSHFRIRKLPVSVVFPEDTMTATVSSLTDAQMNGKLIGVIIVVPSMTDTESLSMTQNITVTELVSVART